MKGKCNMRGKKRDGSFDQYLPASNSISGDKKQFSISPKIIHLHYSKQTPIIADPSFCTHLTHSLFFFHLFNLHRDTGEEG